MRTIVIAVLILSALGANLRSSQSTFDFEQLLEQAVQLFQQAYNTAAKGLERQFIQQLYPDTADTVQGEVDACEDQLVSSFMDTEAVINTDIINLFESCNSDDTEDLANQLMQDTLTLMFVNAGQCEFSVDLIGDVNRLAVASAQQGFRLTEAWVGSLQGWANASIAYEPSTANVQPYTDFVDTLAEGVGISQDVIDQADADTANILTTGNQVVEDIAAEDSIPQGDAVEAYNANVRLGNDYGAGMVQVVRNSAGYVRDAVRAVCDIVQGN